MYFMKFIRVQSDIHTFNAIFLCFSLFQTSGWMVSNYTAPRFWLSITFHLWQKSLIVPCLSAEWLAPIIFFICTRSYAHIIQCLDLTLKRIYTKHSDIIASWIHCYWESTKVKNVIKLLSLRIFVFDWHHFIVLYDIKEYYFIASPFALFN